MIIKHLQGGNRLLLPPSMQCVARVAIPAILFAMIFCFSSCAMQKVLMTSEASWFQIYNEVGGEQL